MFAFNPKAGVDQVRIGRQVIGSRVGLGGIGPGGIGPHGAGASGIGRSGTDPSGIGRSDTCRGDIGRSDTGRGGIGVTLIDNALLDPHGVAALGFAQPYSRDNGNLYPGLRAALTESFSSALRAWLTPILQRADVLAANQVIHRDSSFFSFVSTPSERLLPLQCIPHFDSTDPNLLAAVIYLCDSRFGGTAFYRHRRTGYEQITPDNVHNYQLALNADLRAHGPPAKAYMYGNTALFESIYASELRFNRAVVYPGSVLHAAIIPSPFEPPKNHSDWRLTITALLHVGERPPCESQDSSVSSLATSR